jgi:hypothetical protein
MAREEEQHACILHACKAVIENYEDKKLDPSLTAEKTRALKEWLSSYLSRPQRGV